MLKAYRQLLHSRNPHKTSQVHKEGLHKEGITYDSVPLYWASLRGANALSISGLESPSIDSLHSGITGPAPSAIVCFLQESCAEHEGHRATECGGQAV